MAELLRIKGEPGRMFALGREAPYDLSEMPEFVIA
jgi:hypothetical protein